MSKKQTVLFDSPLQLFIDMLKNNHTIVSAVADSFAVLADTTNIHLPWDTHTHTQIDIDGWEGMPHSTSSTCVHRRSLTRTHTHMLHPHRAKPPLPFPLAHKVYKCMLCVFQRRSSNTFGFLSLLFLSPTHTHNLSLVLARSLSSCS